LSERPSLRCSARVGKRDSDCDAAGAGVPKRQRAGLERRQGPQQRVTHRSLTQRALRHMLPALHAPGRVSGSGTTPSRGCRR
jgi:hypothetical protein